MNASWPRFLKSLYRREPLPSVVITMGAVDAVIGGLNGRPSLLGFGLSIAGLALAGYWWSRHRQAESTYPRAPVYILPDRASRPPLPMLNISRRNPPPS